MLLPLGTPHLAPECHHGSTQGWQSRYSYPLPREESTCLKFEFVPFVMSPGCLFPNKLCLVTA